MLKICTLAVALLLSVATMASAQSMFGTSKAVDASSYLKSAVSGSATMPDTILVVSGKSFDTLTAPFPVEITLTETKYIGGEPTGVTPKYREIFSCTYVNGDTLVLGSRAQYGTLKRSWGAGSKISISPFPAYIKQLQDSSWVTNASSYTIPVPTTRTGTLVRTYNGGAGAYALAAPTAGADDYKILRIVSLSAQAHVVTCSTDGFNAKGSSGTATFAAAIGNAVYLMAYNGHWYAVMKTGVTVA